MNIKHFPFVDRRCAPKHFAAVNINQQMKILTKTTANPFDETSTSHCPSSVFSA